MKVTSFELDSLPASFWIKRAESTIQKKKKIVLKKIFLVTLIA